MSGWIEGDVTANGIRIHYYRTGGDKPSVLLAHGVTDNGLCWRPVAEILQADYDVIMVDARGHGLSEATPDGYRYEVLAADLVGVARALDLQRPALVGHSMGAATVAEAVALSSGLARCVVLEDPPWLEVPRTPAQREQRIERFQANLEKQRQMSHQELIEFCRAQSPSWPDNELEAWAQAKHQVSPHVVELMGGPAQNWREIARAIDCPILLIAADPDRGGIVTPRVADEAATLWRDGRVVTIEGAGHNVRREGFAPFMSALTSFLREHS
ncbi:MAG TPA: alpha/beta hydrolase [Chloroflexi bacterium]|jgi:N-formylmaleamate deformylase|nr:alpha/beta hydrolase [Chloroflexota bacterium]